MKPSSHVERRPATSFRRHPRTGSKIGKPSKKVVKGDLHEERVQCRACTRGIIANTVLSASPGKAWRWADCDPIDLRRAWITPFGLPGRSPRLNSEKVVRVPARSMAMIVRRHRGHQRLFGSCKPRPNRVSNRSAMELLTSCRVVRVPLESILNDVAALDRP